MYACARVCNKPIGFIAVRYSCFNRLDYLEGRSAEGERVSLYPFSFITSLSLTFVAIQQRGRKRYARALYRATIISSGRVIASSVGGVSLFH